MDHPLPGLKYVAAKDLDDSGMTFSGVEVDGVDGEKLGEVEGFVMDVTQGRPRHVAVGAGWFIHKHFLLPIGHVSRSADGKKLIADITKERVERFPGFDKSEFERLGPDQLTQLDATMAAACAADGSGSGALDDHYRVPGWWKTPSAADPAMRR
jgi:uncharacterized protein YrrD